MIDRADRSPIRYRQEAPIASQAHPSTLLGQIIREERGHLYVRADDKLYLCSIRSKLRKELIFPESDSGLRGARTVKSIRDLGPIAVGDLVRFTPAEGDSGAIEERLPRKTILARRASGPRELRQVVVANADQLLAVFSLTQPQFDRKLADRLLVSAENASLPPVVCINKVDLLPPARASELGSIYQQAGYQAIRTSALDGTGLDDLRSALQDKLTVLAGPSGVGKSTLLNRLQPGLGLKVKEVSHATGQGRHATSNIQMFPLDFGGSVVDTPGIRYLDPWELPEDHLPSLFPEFRPYLDQCHFATCAHLGEPHCAVRAALEAGSIHESRYESYRELRRELHEAAKRRYSS